MQGLIADSVSTYDYNGKIFSLFAIERGHKCELCWCIGTDKNNPIQEKYQVLVTLVDPDYAHSLLLQYKAMAAAILQLHSET